MTQPDLYELQRAFAGHYSFVRELGRGGMGIVYLAREVELDRLVAIKILPPHLAEQIELRSRFLREARLAAGLSHPNIVPIHRVGELGGFVFIAMAYIEGETLGHRLRERGPMSPTAAARVLREIAWALAHAHGRGVVHRDIKPDNILLETGTGRALVSDFGIAEIARSGSVRASPVVMGTEAFMSPEQAGGLALDGRSDIYSLGVLGHLALTGRLPVPGDRVGALVGTADPTDQAYASLGRALARCLAAQPEHRFANGALFAEALAEAAPPPHQLPAVISQWMSDPDPAAAVYAPWSGVLALSGLLAANMPLAIGSFALATLPLVPYSIFRFRQLSRVLRAGYTVDDLCLALSERDREQARATEPALKTAVRTPRMRRLLDASLVVSTTALFGGVGLAAAGLQVAQRVLDPVAFSSAGVIFASLFVRGALGIPLPGVHRERRLNSKRRARFWNSRFARWIARLAAPAGRGGDLAHLAHRRTEVAIALAADRLYAELPTVHREQLTELPSVILELQKQATDLRSRIASLNTLVEDAAAGAYSDDLLSAPAGDSQRTVAERREEVIARLNSSREEAREQLARSVAALEAIRLDLLRLQGGVSEISALTTGLDAARRVAKDLGRLAAAHGELDQLKAAFSPSPA
jgi:serine/threonine-protein kinase